MRSCCFVLFYHRTELISGHSINNTLKECLKDFKVSFDDIFFKGNSVAH